MSEDDFVVVHHSRGQEQRTVMDKIQESIECPFCPENLTKYHKQEIIQHGQYWLLTKNQWPYEHTSQHFLLISKIHAQKLGDLPSGSGEEMLAMIQWIEEEFSIASGSLFLRFGDPRHNGGSVNHLHFQLIVPDLSDPGWDKLKVKLGSK